MGDLTSHTPWHGASSLRPPQIPYLSPQQYVWVPIPISTINMSPGILKPLNGVDTSFDSRVRWPAQMTGSILFGVSLLSFLGFRWRIRASHYVLGTTGRYDFNDGIVEMYVCALPALAFCLQSETWYLCLGFVEFFHGFSAIIMVWRYQTYDFYDHRDILLRNSNNQLHVDSIPWSRFWAAFQNILI